MTNHIVIRLAAPNDRYGNPRRVFVVYQLEGTKRVCVDVLDEGYQGDVVWKEKYPDAVYLSSFPVPVSTYKEVLRYGYA